MPRLHRFGMAILILSILLPALALAAGELASDEKIVVRFFSDATLVKTLTVNAKGEAKWDVKEKSLEGKITSTRAYLVRGPMEVQVGGAPGGNYATEYRIGPGDVLDINVWDNQQISKVVPVRPDGMISIPLVGDVRVGGLTAAQLKEMLQKELTRFVGNPIVTITVTAINSYQVYVQGQVMRPGAFPITGSTTITQAVSLAGGFTQFADRNGIIILRNSGGTTTKIKVKYSKILAGKIPDVRVEPGDTVVVP